VHLGYIAGTNCYIVKDIETNETMVIDPGGDVKIIANMVKAMEGEIKYIVLTHCHGDHISGATQLKEKLGGQILIHIDDYEGLKNPDVNLADYIGLGEIKIEADSRLHDGDLIHLGNLQFKVIHTPGHTKGSISLYCEEKHMLFSGDTMFRGYWGRIDLPTASLDDIIDSITKKLIILPDETIVYPGHGKSTMIKDEKPIYLELKGKKY